MSLPARQQRVLNAMENALQGSEPRLASMFAIFARLNKGEPVSAEALRSWSWRTARTGTPLYALAVIPLMFIMVIGMLIGGTARGAAACGSQHRASGSSPMFPPACPSAAQSAFSNTTGTGAAGPMPGAARRSCAARPVRAGAFPQPAAAGGTTPHPPVTC